MIEMIKTILDVIGTLFDFLVNSIRSLISLIANIPKFTVFIIESLPPFLIPFSLAFVSIVSVQYILGRKSD